MEKEFDAWNVRKQSLNKERIDKFCHPREIWWCTLGVNIGFEQDGTGRNFARPFVIVRGFNESIFWGAALTTREKAGKYYFPIGLVERKNASVILSQIRLFDARRLVRKIATLDGETFEKLKNALQRALFN